VIGNQNGQLACESLPERRRLWSEVPNEEDIPSGTYTSSCGGCSVDENVGSATEGVLTCSHCNTGGGTAENEYADAIASSIVVAECVDGQVIGNVIGKLTCEQAPEQDPDPTMNDGPTDDSAHEEL
jgi:hypothetical protein